MAKQLLESLVPGAEVEDGVDIVELMGPNRTRAVRARPSLWYFQVQVAMVSMRHLTLSMESRPSTHYSLSLTPRSLDHLIHTETLHRDGCTHQPDGREHAA